MGKLDSLFDEVESKSSLDSLFDEVETQPQGAPFGGMGDVKAAEYQATQPNMSRMSQFLRGMAPRSMGYAESQPAPMQPINTAQRPSSFADFSMSRQDPAMAAAPALDALSLPARAVAKLRGQEMSDPNANFFNPEAEQVPANVEAQNAANPYQGQTPNNFADFGQNAVSGPGQIIATMAGDPLSYGQAPFKAVQGMARGIKNTPEVVGRGLEAMGESQMRRVMKPLIRHERKAPKPTEQVIYEHGLDQGPGGSNPRIIHDRAGQKLEQLGAEVQKRIKAGMDKKVRINTDQIIDEVVSEFMASPGSSADWYKTSPYAEKLAAKFKEAAASANPDQIGNLDIFQAKNFQRHLGELGAWEELAKKKGIPVKAKKSAESVLAEKIYHRLGDHIDEVVPEGLRDLNRQINELIPVHQVTGWRKVISERQNPLSLKGFIGTIAATLNPKVWPILAMNAVSESATAASKIYRLGEKLRTAKTPADQARYAGALKKLGLTDQEIQASMQLVESSGGKGAFEAQDLRISPPVNIPEPRRAPRQPEPKQSARNIPMGPRQSIAANYKVALPEAEGLTSPINPQVTPYDPLEAMNPFSKRIQPPIDQRQPVGYGVEDLAPIPRVEQEINRQLERNIPDIRPGEPVLGDVESMAREPRPQPPETEAGSIVLSPKPKPPAPVQASAMAEVPPEAPTQVGGLEYKMAWFRRRQAEKYLRYSLKREPKQPELTKFLQEHEGQDIPKPPEREIKSRQFKGRRTERELDGMDNLLRNGDPEWATVQVPVNQAPESFTIGGMELKRTRGQWDNQIAYKDKQGRVRTFRGDETIHMDAPKQPENPRLLEQSPPKDDFYDDNGEPLFQSPDFAEGLARDRGYKSLGNGKYEKNGKLYEWSTDINWFDTPKPKRKPRINSTEAASERMWESVQKEFPETDFEHSFDKSKLSESRYITVSQNGRDINIRISGHERHNKTYGRPDIDVRIGKNESENIARIKEAIATAKGYFSKDNPSILNQSEKLFSPKGQIVRRDGKSSITLFKGRADVSTLMHEHAHWLRSQALDETQQAKALKAFGGSTWDREAEEKFARGFERYLFEGKAPHESLGQSFATMKSRFAEIYKDAKGTSIEAELPEEMRMLYDAVLLRGVKPTSKAKTIITALGKKSIKPIQRARLMEILAAELQQGDQ